MRPKPVSVLADMVAFPAPPVPKPRGVFFRVMGKHTRAVYAQLDGTIILAAECRCKTDWQPDFYVMRTIQCPIDEHQVAARLTKKRTARA